MAPPFGAKLRLWYHQHLQLQSDIRVLYQDMKAILLHYDIQNPPEVGYVHCPIYISNDSDVDNYKFQFSSLLAILSTDILFSYVV